jgi:hypothetical protein
VANPNPSPETRFEPGRSGNPGGRAKGRSVAKILRELREQTEIDGVPVPGGKTLGELLAQRIVSWALQGDEKFVRIFLDRSEGGVRPVFEDRPPGDERPRLTTPDYDGRFESLPEG